MSSCTFKLFNTYQPVDRESFDRDSIIFWFHDDTAFSLFRTTIDMPAYHYSGIMVFNPVSAEGYRVIYMTEFGLKIFDMEFFTGREFKLHYCMPSLNRKSVINTLRDDIGLLVKHVPDDESYKTFYDRQTGSIVIKAKEKGQKYCLLFDNETNRVVSVIQASPLVKKARADFYSGNNDKLDSIKIEHYNKNLIIKLIQLHESASPVHE